MQGLDELLDGRRMEKIGIGGVGKMGSALKETIDVIVVRARGSKKKRRFVRGREMETGENCSSTGPYLECSCASTKPALQR